MKTDQELLREFVRSHTENAFAELVKRHVGLVYAAAFRETNGNAAAAQDVTQLVFIELARKASTLQQHPTLAGWLYMSVRFVSANARRVEQRRIIREEEAHTMNELLHSNATDPAWDELKPVLDDAMHELNEPDRNAVLLRYFEGKNLREVGESLSLSENTARMRVDRALEKLQKLLAKRGVTSTSSVLAKTLSAAVMTASPSLIASVTSSALAAIVIPAALTGTAIVTTTATITMTTLQKTLFTAALAAAVGTGIYQARQVALLRHEAQKHQQQQASLTEHIEQLQRQRDESANRLAALADEIERAKGNSAELPKLRGEVGRLRQTAQEFAQLKAGDATLSEAISWQERVKLLKQHAEQNPGVNIPELQFAREQDWLDAARGDLETEEDFRRAMSGLRGTLESRFAQKIHSALRGYLDANQKKFPTDLSQLQPYFKPPVDEAILKRYAILPKEEIPNLGMGGDWIISQKLPVDEEFDHRVGIGPNGTGSTGFKTRENLALVSTLEPVFKAYLTANGGREPADPAELLPYIKTPEQRAAYERAIALKSAR